MLRQLRHLARRRVLRTVSRAGTAPSAAAAGRRTAPAPAPAPAWAAARHRSYGATACRPHAASAAAGLWSHLTESLKQFKLMKPNDRTLETLHKPEHELAKMRTAELQRLVKAGDMAAAHALMDQLKDTGTANVVHFSIMLRACKDSTEMRRVIGTEMPAAGVEPDVFTFNTLISRLEDSDEMRRVIGTEMLAAGVEPNVVTFNTLVSQLMIEGDAAGARRVVEQEMPAAGVQPNNRTLKTLRRSERILAKMRAAGLQRLVKAGDMAGAHVLMSKLKDTDNANVVHFSIMLRACKDSTEMRRVIGTEMPAAGVEPNVVTFTTLIKRLMFEGDAAGARRVVEEEMPATGVQPNGRTFQQLKTSNRQLAKMRNAQLQRLLNMGDVGAACALMDKLVKRGAADGTHRAMMRNHYHYPR